MTELSRRGFLKSAFVLTPALFPQEETLDLTEDNIEGPYYLPNAPWRAEVAEKAEKGTRIVVAGVVKARNGRPLAEAVLDVWQADATGAYHNDENDDPKVYRLRSRLKADAKGRYSFETIRPGRYKIGPNRFRPAHIHVKASKDGYKLLTTQLYFRDDEINKVDPWYRPSLALDPKDGKAEFTVVLAKE